MTKFTNQTDNRLIERRVQEAAQGFLESYYKAWHRNRIYSNLEERTKKKYGMKRADGLLAYRKNRRKAFVVSMEAKSHKTLPALKPYRVNSLWIKDSIWKGLLFCILSGTIFFIWNYDTFSPLLQMLMPFSFWMLSSLLYAILFKNSYRYQEMKVLKQVLQYPANEQWLSFSHDAFDMIKPKMRDNLFKICKARGIGVLMVSQDRRVSLISKAKRRRSIVGKDYLKYYLEEDNIRHYLGIKKSK
jgi:hypothetical protein